MDTSALSSLPLPLPLLSPSSWPHYCLAFLFFFPHRTRVSGGSQAPSLHGTPCRSRGKGMPRRPPPRPPSRRAPRPGRRAPGMQATPAIACSKAGPALPGLLGPSPSPSRCCPCRAPSCTHRRPRCTPWPSSPRARPGPFPATSALRSACPRCRAARSSSCPAEPRGEWPLDPASPSRRSAGAGGEAAFAKSPASSSSACSPPWAHRPPSSPRRSSCASCVRGPSAAASCTWSATSPSW